MPGEKKDQLHGEGGELEEEEDGGEEHHDRQVGLGDAGLAAAEEADKGRRSDRQLHLSLCAAVHHALLAAGDQDAHPDELDHGPADDHLDEHLDDGPGGGHHDAEAGEGHEGGRRGDEAGHGGEEGGGHAAGQPQQQVGGHDPHGQDVDGEDDEDGRHPVAHGGELLHGPDDAPRGGQVVGAAAAAADAAVVHRRVFPVFRFPVPRSLSLEISGPRRVLTRPVIGCVVTVV